MNLIVTILLCLIWVIGESKGDTSINYMMLAYKDQLKYLSQISNYNISNDLEDKVFFYLYTRREKEKQQLFSGGLETLLLSNFNVNVPTKIIIHGYLDNYERPMSQSIKDNLLHNEDVNAILVDWSDIARGIDYIGITKKTPAVGAFIGKFMNFLVQQGTRFDDIHLIGHSLGAHAAGFAGAAVTGGKVRRITGLDPAKPGFHLAPPEKRLDPSDAQFVDCIHTCSGILGLAEPICTADFYPNGGVNIQPGCHFYDFGRCSHSRAFGYFNESIDPQYKYPALECNSVPDDSVTPSSCLPSKMTMGYHIIMDISGIYFVTTNSEEPYAPIHP